MIDLESFRIGGRYKIWCACQNYIIVVQNLFYMTKCKEQEEKVYT